MAHLHSVYDTDSHFSINPITRAIKNESSSKTVLIQTDHNSERFTFEIQRLIEGHDMSQCTKIEVHYINIDSQTKETSKGVYEVDDMQLSPESEDVVIFSWLIKGNATKFVGGLNFLIRFSCVQADGTIDYAWNTAIFTGISVSTGIYNSEIVVEQYSDVLEQWKQELLAAGKMDEADIAKAVEEYLEKNPIETGATEEQAKQITQNKTDISTLQQQNTNLEKRVETLEQNGTGTGNGLTTEQIDLLDEIGNYIPFTSTIGGTKWDELIASLRGESSGEEEPDEPTEPDTPEVTLSSISASYSGGDVAEGTPLTDLTGITVTATYSDGTSKTVTDYTLSGKIVEGENTITVSYNGKTTTFTVVGIAESTDVENNGWVNGVPYDIKWNIGYSIDASTGADKEYATFSTTDFIPCKGANRCTVYGTSNDVLYFYDADKNFIIKENFCPAIDENNAHIMDTAHYVRFDVRTNAPDGDGEGITLWKDDLLTENTAWEVDKFYRANWTDGIYINTTTGVEQANASNSSTDFMICYGATSLQFSRHARCFIYWYDNDKNFISYVIRQNTDNALTIPENAIYFRCAVADLNANWWFKLA